MRRWCIVTAAFLAAAALISCATTKSAEPVVQVQAVPAAEPAPVMVEQPYWVLNRVETAYPDGILSAVQEYVLDDTGRILKESSFDGKGTLISSKVWAWSGDTAKLEMLDAAGAVVGKGVQEWSKGLLMKETRSTAKDELQSTEEYEYDADGNKVHWSVQTAKGNSVTTAYTWEMGRITGISVKDATGAEIKRFVRAYDGAGLPVSEEEYDAKGALARKITYKTSGGFVTAEEARNGSGGMLSSIKYDNDEHGNPVLISYLDRTGRLIETRKQAWTGYTRLVRQK